MFDDPVRKLQKQTACARYVAQQQRLRQSRKRDRTNLHAINLGHNADVGLDLIRLPDGSARYAGSQTNGAIGVGDAVSKMHQGQGMPRIDTNPALRRKPRLPEYFSSQPLVTFWVLWSNYLMEWVVKGKEVTIKLITKATDYPYPYSEFHDSASGVCRINKTEFYMPYFYHLSKYNIATLSAQTIYGETEYDFFTYTIQNTHATFSLPDLNFLFSVEMRNTEETRLYHINPLGELNFITVTTNFDPVAEIWSIAALDPNTMYLVFYNIAFALFDKIANELTILFTSIREDIPSLFGNSVDGDKIEEITYAFMDSKNKCCYVVGVIIDSQVPGLEYEYPLNDLRITGEAPTLPDYENDLIIVKADFPTGIVNPGDFIRASSTPYEPGHVYKVINDSTVYCARAGYNYDFNNFNYQTQGTLSTKNRHYRTAIWKVTPDLQVSLYYKFPTVDNRQSADGYRLFYNTHCKSAIIDPKSKDIYMYGQRRDVIKNGIWNYISENGFDKGNLVKITRSKQLVILKNKFHSSVSENDKQALIDNWRTYDVQLEPIYK